jgi:hypothetical protein
MTVRRKKNAITALFAGGFEDRVGGKLVGLVQDLARHARSGGYEYVLEHAFSLSHFT